MGGGGGTGKTIHTKLFPWTKKMCKCFTVFQKGGGQHNTLPSASSKPLKFFSGQFLLKWKLALKAHLSDNGYAGHACGSQACQHTNSYQRSDRSL